MPCPIEKDYQPCLKSLIEEILGGNDAELQACACALTRIPLDDEGCPCVDQDKKVIAFPFCLATSCPSFPPEYNLKCDIGLPYKDAMKFFWNIYKPMTINFQAKGDGGGYPCWGTWSSSGSSTSQSDPISKKDIFCQVGSGGARGGGCYSGEEKGCTPRSDGGTYPYPTADVPYYLGTSFGIWIEYQGSRAWIDKGSKLIYPYYGGMVSLNGCCGNLRATNGSYSDNKITIDIASDGGPCEACTDGCGVATGKIEVTNLLCN
jgi:hypothetical protein